MNHRSTFRRISPSNLFQAVMKPFRLICIILWMIQIITLAGCGGVNERKAEYYRRGNQHLADKNYDKARIEFKNLVQIDPKDATGTFALGKTEEAAGNLKNAFGWYIKTLELDPDHEDVKLKLARIYIGFKLEEAKQLNDSVLALDPERIEAKINKALILAKQGETEHARELLSRLMNSQPGNIEAPMFLALLYEQLGDTKQQIITLQQATANNPENIPLQEALIQTYYKNASFDQVEQALQKLITLSDDNRHVVALAALHNKQKNFAKAESVLRQGIAKDADDEDLYIRLAVFLMQQNKFEQAVAELETAIRKHPEFQQLPFTLAKTFIENNDREQAEKVYRGLIEQYGVAPIALRARNYLALQSLELNDTDAAKRLLDQVLEENPNDNHALYLKGVWALGQGDSKEAVSLLRGLIRDQPDNAKIHKLLAEAFALDNKKNLARDHLEKAVALNPSDSGYRLQLAKLLADDESYEPALEQVERVLEQAPKSLEALAAKARILENKQDRDGSIRTLKEMQSAHPETAFADFELGRVFLADGDLQTARTEFENALAKSPDSATALAALTKALAAAGDYSEAEQRIQQFLQRNPDNGASRALLGRLYVEQKRYPQAIVEFKQAVEQQPGFASAMASLVGAYMAENKTDDAEDYIQEAVVRDPQHPIAHTFLAITRISRQKYTAAETDLKRAIEINPTWDQSYDVLASLYRKLQQPEKALATYRAGLEALPNHPNLSLKLALFHQAQGDIEAAVNVYESMLKHQPSNTLVKNNLASILTDYRNDRRSLERARDLTQGFEDANRPTYLDTLGWVLVKMGDVERALPLLQKAQQKSSNSALLQYHLGVAYYRQGAMEKAKRMLVAALDHDQDFPGSDQALKLREKLDQS